MRRFGRTVCIAAGVALLAAGCTGGGGGSDEGSGEEPGGRVTLDLWIFEGEEEFLPALESAFEDET